MHALLSSPVLRRLPHGPVRHNIQPVLPACPRQQLATLRTRVRSAESPDRAAPVAVTVDSEQTLQQLGLLRKRLEQAIAKEDYALAQQLKQQADSIREQLSPVKQYMLGQIDRLKTGSLGERQAAVKALASVGDESCTEGLAACLQVPELHDQAEDALWAIWLRHPNPEAQALMNQGLTLLRDSTRLHPALEVFDAACRMEPSWAETHNKRATLLYLMHKYAESVEVCKLVLELNPYHFGALSGMGLCYIELQDYKAALNAFERALAINPGMQSCERYVLALRAQLADD